MRTLSTIAILAAAAFVLAGCSGPTESGAAPTSGSSGTTSPPTASPYPAPAKSTSVYGSGATFPKPIIEAWGLQFAREESNVQVSYAGGGSGKGISDITKKDVVFAGSDAPMSPGEKAAAPGILQFPETLGAIAVVYNVASIADGLKLDGETIGQIFAGDIKNWNHPAIAALNPGVTLPDASIAIVYRSDSSGTTFAYTDFLVRTSPTFKSDITPAASKKPDWTKSTATQLSGNGNDGVGSTVKTTPNSIGYVELAYVKSLALKAAKVKSHDGAFLAPSSAGASAAAAGFANSLPAANADWSAVSIADAPGANAYPISTFSYMMVYDSAAAYGSKATSDQIAAFKAWMWWCLHDGQQYSEALGYAPLPTSVVAVGEAALASIH